MNLRYILRLILNKYQYPRHIRWKVVVRRELWHNKTYICKDGSCFSIAPDGDIEGMCRNKRGTLSGSEILKQALQKGGIKCNSFGAALFDFYCKNGFTPVSWCAFDWQYAPFGATHAEELVFFAYTGEKSNISYQEFLKQKPAADFMAAYRARDNFLKKEKTK